MPHFAIQWESNYPGSKNILMIASGAKKAGIVAKALEGPVTSQVTASAIQLYGGKLPLCWTGSRIRA